MAVYYIASASSGGSSGNTGLSISSPWPLSKLNTFENAGDTIIVNKGDTLGSIILGRSGTSGNRITYDIYGSATNNPIFDGGNSSSVRTVVVTGAFINILNHTIQNSFVAAYGTLFISATHDVTIRNCHISGGYRGIHAQNCTGNIVIDGNFIENISHLNGASTTGPASGDGALIQLDNCTGPGNAITNNKCYTASPNPGVGDIISLYISNGTTGSWIQVTGNSILGGSTGSNGYCGIGLGDNGGQYQFVQHNLISKSGWAGIQIAGGDSINASYNKIYAPATTFPQGGVGTLDGLGIFSTGTAPTNLNVGFNNINWTNRNGSVVNLFLQPGVGIATPANYSTNTASNVADPLAPSSIVPTPLFNAGDWNITAIPVISYPSSVYSVIQGILTSALNINSSSYYPVTSYSISPALPAGLSFNTSTGQISGTPTVLTANTSYTITANSIAGPGTTIISLQVIASGLVQFFKPIKFI